MSTVTFLKSLWTDSRASKEKQATIFERDYGSTVRDELRSFSKALGVLRGFTYKSGKPVEQVLSELEKMRGDWIKAAEEVCVVLGEVDRGVTLLEPAWESGFRAHAELAEEALSRIAEEASFSEDDLVVAAISGLEHYKAGVEDVRQRLLHESERYSATKLRKVSRGKRYSDRR